MSLRKDARALVSGSSGLFGAEVADYFCGLGCDDHGSDENMRADFYGPERGARRNQRRLLEEHGKFSQNELDIRAATSVRGEA